MKQTAASDAYGKKIVVTIEIDAHDKTKGAKLSDDMIDLVNFHGNRVVFCIRELLRKEHAKSRELEPVV